ncbi:phospholipase A1 member A-like [Teleopsis dalmanni]|uniref:phospholipase A1 member A-like n=1 Tax=Teleopsis dalmanni TaxID=139649 RepID=UPI0018CF500B|nr:phospholipase A1 member A-like [Teleopsis dalmanni]
MNLFGVYICIQFALLASALIPESEFIQHILFKLYTNKNPEDPQILRLCDYFSIRESNYNTRLQTKILIHGYIPNFDKRNTYVVRDAYLSLGDYNFIEVDWTYFSNTTYPKAVQLVPKIGEEVAKFVDDLNELFELNFNESVIIGHSLGAHVSGFVGKFVKRGKIAGIVGLDPASIGYDYAVPGTHLEKTDANYVETLHVSTIRGTLLPVGDVSFYANYGRELPGCDGGIVVVRDYCSHEGAPRFYAAAIVGKLLGPYYKCESFKNILEQNGCTELSVTAKIGDPLVINHVEGLYNLAVTDGDI